MPKLVAVAVYDSQPQVGMSLHVAVTVNVSLSSGRGTPSALLPCIVNVAISTTSIVSSAGADSREENSGTVRVSTTLRVVESLTRVIATEGPPIYARLITASIYARLAEPVYASIVTPAAVVKSFNISTTTSYEPTNIGSTVAE